MRVSESSLTYRFYTSDGWTRDKVTSYMKSPNMHFVFPRWYDGEKDSLTKDCKHFLFENNQEYLDCDYYAIHSPAIEAELDMDRLNAEHEVIPFSMTATGEF